MTAACGFDRPRASRLWVVHMRDSPQKTREHGRMPPSEAIPPKIPIMWQTPHLAMRRRAIAWSAAERRDSGYTNNSRSVAGRWGGRDASWIDEGRTRRRDQQLRWTPGGWPRIPGTESTCTGHSATRSSPADRIDFSSQAIKTSGIPSILRFPFVVLVTEKRDST